MGNNAALDFFQSICLAIIFVQLYFIWRRLP